MSNQIKLETTKETIHSLLEQQLSDSIFTKYLTPNAKTFFIQHATLKHFRKEEYLSPNELHGTFFWVLSGTIYLIFSYQEIQKHFGTLEKGKFFALRRDFNQLKLYTPENLVAITLTQEHLLHLFKLAPATTELVKKTILDIHFKLEELKTHYSVIE